MWYNLNHSKLGPLFLKKEELESGEILHRPWQEPSVMLYAITDAEQLVDFAIEQALQGIRATAGSIFLWDDREKMLVFRKALGTNAERLKDVRIKLRQGVLGWVGETGDPLLVKDIREDDRFQRLERPGTYRSASFISLPLVAHNKLVGVMNITEREDLTAFDEGDLLHASVFASHFAAAYENLRLRTEIQRQNEDLAQLRRELEERLLRDEPLARLGRLALDLACEFHNPLDAIRRYLHLAQEAAGPDGRLQEFLGKAGEASQAAVRLLRHLVQWSRESAGASGDGLEQLLEEIRRSAETDPVMAAFKKQKGEPS